MPSKKAAEEILKTLKDQTGMNDQDVVEEYCTFLRDNDLAPEHETEWCSYAFTNPDFWNAFLMHINHRETSISKDAKDKYTAMLMEREMNNDK
jgi:hypothetical protein